MQDPIQLEPYRLEPDSYKVFVFSLQFKRLVMMSAYFLASCLLLGFVVFPEQALLFALIGVGISVLLFFTQWNACLKMAKNPLNKHVWSSVQMEFDDLLIRLAGSQGTRSEVPFQVIVKAHEHRNHFLMYLSSHQFFIVPAKAFRSKEHEDRFRNILKSHGHLKKGKGKDSK